MTNPGADGRSCSAIRSCCRRIQAILPSTADRTASSVARTLAFLEQNGLDRSYVDNYGSALAAATEESVAASIAEVYPAADSLVFVIVGDAEKIRDDVARYGPVTEMSITEPHFSPR